MDRKILNKLIYSTIVIGLALSISAQDLQAAAELEKKGENAKAVATYRLWLDKNQEDPGFYTVLKHTADLIPTAEETLQILEEYLSAVRDPENKRSCIRKILVLLDVLGKSEEAVQFLQSYTSVLDADILTDYAAMLCGSGEFRQALDITAKVFQTQTTNAIWDKAALVHSRALVALQDASAAAGFLEKYLQEHSKRTPSLELAYYLCEVYAITSNKTKAEILSGWIIQHFPNSPEAALLKKKSEISLLLKPDRVFGNQDNSTLQQVAEDTNSTTVISNRTKSDPSKKLYLQTGAYRVQENAEYMVIDLKKAGFAGQIRKYKRGNIDYYKVLVPVPAEEEYSLFVAKLRDKGFEGFLISE